MPTFPLVLALLVSLVISLIYSITMYSIKPTDKDPVKDNNNYTGEALKYVFIAYLATIVAILIMTIKYIKAFATCV